MRTIKGVTIFLLASLLIVSCKKIIETNPAFSLEGKNLKSIEDYEFALTGTYASFQSTSYYGATNAASNAFVCLPDMLSDNLGETGESLGNERVFSRWSYAEDE